MEKKNIFQRMAAVTEELRPVAKNLTVSAGGKNSYKAVSERDVLDAVKPLEFKHGIYSYASGRKVLESQTLESEDNYGKKKTTFFSRIETSYRFVNVDDPLDYIETVTFSEGIDPQDKGSGKAMTYADKYALMKAYKISTGDDPDQNASNDEYYRPASKSIEETPVQNLTCKCANCGKEIPDYFDDNGKKISASRWSSGTFKKYGKYLCKTCIPFED